MCVCVSGCLRLCVSCKTWVYVFGLLSYCLIQWVYVCVYVCENTTSPLLLFFFLFKKMYDTSTTNRTNALLTLFFFYLRVT